MNDPHKNHPSPDDPGPDPLLDFLGEQIRQAEPHEDLSMERGWKPAGRKIAAIAASALIITTGAVFLSVSSVRGPSSTDGTEMAAQEPSPDQEGIAARVALLEGNAVLLRSGKRVMVAETDQVRPGDSLETSKESAIGLTYPDGTALVLDGEGLLSVRKADGKGVRVGLIYGTITARVPPESREKSPLTITGSNATLTVRGTVFSVSAERGRLTDAAVSEGNVEILNTRTDRTYRLSQHRRIDMNSWSLSPGAPDASALSRLARITDGVEVQKATMIEEIKPEAGEGRPLNTAERIQKALDQGDVDAAVKLADKHRGNKSISFNMIAGEAYRRAGKWSEAVDAYLIAAEAGSGKTSEKAMLKAAGITLRKQNKPSQAVKVIDSYMTRFPSGWHMEEALYIGGVANSKSGNYPKARKQFETYLKKYPDGTQAVQVHFVLAKILTRKLSACASAARHIKAIKSKAPGSSMAAEADKLATECQKGTSP